VSEVRNFDNECSSRRPRVSSDFCGMSMIEKTRPLWLRYSRKLCTGSPRLSARTRQSSLLHRSRRYRDIAFEYRKCGISTTNAPLDALNHRCAAIIAFIRIMHRISAECQWCGGRRENDEAAAFLWSIQIGDCGRIRRIRVRAGST